MIFIIIPVYNRWTYTEACLFSLQKQNYTNYRVIVVDHGSTDGTQKKISEYFSEVILLNGDQSMWWSAATNVGVRYALEQGVTGNYVLTLNNDLIVDSDFLSNLHQFVQHNNRCLVGSITINIENKESVVYSGIKWSNTFAKYTPANSKLKSLKDIDLIRDDIIISDILTGRGTLIPIECFHEVGLFDEEKFPHYMGDEDFSLRAKKKGYSLYILKYARVYSHINESGIDLSKTNPKKFLISLISIKSAINLKRRWHWAIRHSPIGPLYFLIDFSRILISSLRLMLKNA